MAVAGASALLASSPNEAGQKSGLRPLGDPYGFIDSHVHVWTNDFQHYPISRQFTPQDMVPPTFLPEDILRVARRSGVTRVVLIQVRFYGSDNSYMVETIRRMPTVFRGVAVVDWKGSHPDVEMRELAKHGVRGFRIRAEGPSRATFLEGESIEKMFRCGAQERWAICLLLDPDNLPGLGKRCEQFPETPVVIDHLARIGTTGPLVESNIQMLCALAKYPEVKVKVSAFYGAGAKRPPHLELAPFIERLYHTFGPQRLMWGSDCPYQVATETYEDSISLVRDRLNFLSADDKQWLLCKTAEATFFAG
jgi:predicted TIM-barrel fold metal-dependent hydrolase